MYRKCLCACGLALTSILPACSSSGGPPAAPAVPGSELDGGDESTAPAAGDLFASQIECGSSKPLVRVRGTIGTMPIDTSYDPVSNFTHGKLEAYGPITLLWDGNLAKGLSSI